MYFEDLSIGQMIEIPPVYVTLEDIKAFAAKYDPLSIHTDEAYAAQSIYGGIIAPGLFTLCAVWGAWGKLKVLDKEVVGGLGIDYLNWSAPVRPGDTLYGTIEVADLVLSSKGGRGVLTIKLTVKNQLEETVMTEQVKALISCRP